MIRKVKHILFRDTIYLLLLSDCLSFGWVGLGLTLVLRCLWQTQQIWRGEKYELDLLPKISMDLVVKDNDVDKILNLIISSARTGGDKGEGKIFVYDVERVIRIRTGEEGELAI